MDTATSIQVLLSVLTVLGAGISVYVGVRIALAEIKSKQAQHDLDIADHDARIKYLERQRDSGGYGKRT